MSGNQNEIEMKQTALLKEYDRFYELTKTRSNETWLLGSIFIAISLLIFLNATLYAKGILTAGLLAIASFLCFGFWFLFYGRTSKLDDICFTKLCEIENKIQRISENKMCINVHRYLKNNEEAKRLRCIGQKIINGFFGLFIILWILLFLLISYRQFA